MADAVALITLLIGILIGVIGTTFILWPTEIHIPSEPQVIERVQYVEVPVYIPAEVTTTPEPKPAAPEGVGNSVVTSLGG